MPGRPMPGCACAPADGCVRITEMGGRLESEKTVARAWRANESGRRKRPEKNRMIESVFWAGVA